MRTAKDGEPAQRSEIRPDRLRGQLQPRQQRAACALQRQGEPDLALRNCLLTARASSAASSPRCPGAQSRCWPALVICTKSSLKNAAPVGLAHHRHAFLARLVDSSKRSEAGHNMRASSERSIWEGDIGKGYETIGLSDPSLHSRPFPIPHLCWLG